MMNNKIIKFLFSSFVNLLFLYSVLFYITKFYIIPDRYEYERQSTLERYFGDKVNNEYLMFLCGLMIIIFFVYHYNNKKSKKSDN